MTSTAALPTQRKDLLTRLGRTPSFDLAVVGGGATGVGVALDAAARGFSVVLIEARAVLGQPAGLAHCGANRRCPTGGGRLGQGTTAVA